jgi:hypothetical protein
VEYFARNPFHFSILPASRTISTTQLQSNQCFRRTSKKKSQIDPTPAPGDAPSPSPINVTHRSLIK